MTREEFYLVSHATGKGRISMNAQGERPYDIKLRLEEVFEIYLAKLQQLHKRGRLTIASIKTYPLARQMEFNSKLLKLAGQTDIMEELQNLSAEELKAVIAMVKNRQNLG